MIAKKAAMAEAAITGSRKMTRRSTRRTAAAPAAEPSGCLSASLVNSFAPGRTPEVSPSAPAPNTRSGTDARSRAQALGRAEVPLARASNGGAADGSASTVRSTEPFFALVSTTDEPASCPAGGRCPECAQGGPSSADEGVPGWRLRSVMRPRTKPLRAAARESTVEPRVNSPGRSWTLTVRRHVIRPPSRSRSGELHP